MIAAYCQAAGGNALPRCAILSDMYGGDGDGRQILNVGPGASCCDTQRRTMALDAALYSTQTSDYICWY